LIANSHLTIRPVDDDERRWVLVEQLEYRVPMEVIVRAGGPRRIVVRAGFQTDLASIPRAFWAILPPFGRYTAAAVLHDYLYQAHDGTRLHADMTFLAAMEELKVRRWKRAVMYQAVRLFGKPAWDTTPSSGGLI